MLSKRFVSLKGIFFFLPCFNMATFFVLCLPSGVAGCVLTHFSPVLPPRTLEGLHRSSSGEPGGIPGDKTHESMSRPPPPKTGNPRSFSASPYAAFQQFIKITARCSYQPVAPGIASAEQISAVILQSPISPDGRVTARLATSVL